MYRPRIVRTIFGICSSAVLFAAAVGIANKFRIVGDHSPARILDSGRNTFAVSMAFVCLCLVIGQFQEKFFGQKIARVFAAVCLLLVVLLVLLEPIENPFFISYGDWESLIGVVKGPGVFSRWALGSSVLSSIYLLITSFIVHVTAAKYLSIFSALFVIFATYTTILKSKGRLSFLLPLICPIWIAFCFSYDEYNAFVAPIFLFGALWIFFGEKPKSANVASICAGLLPAVYVGLAPLSIFVVVKICAYYKDWNNRVRFVGIWIFAYIAAIEFSWPRGHLDYLRNLSSDMLLGSSGGFKGRAASEKSPFFNLRTILSAEHLSGVGYLLVFGAGFVAVLFGIGVVLCPFAVKRGFGKQLFLGLGIGWIQSAFIAWNLIYIVALMAKLGPTGDIDAFYSTFFVIAIVVGLIADRIMAMHTNFVRWKSTLVLMIAAFNGPLVAGLLIFGVQTGCHDYSMVRGWCGV